MKGANQRSAGGARPSCGKRSVQPAPQKADALAPARHSFSEELQCSKSSPHLMPAEQHQKPCAWQPGPSLLPKSPPHLIASTDGSARPIGCSTSIADLCAATATDVAASKMVRLAVASGSRPVSPNTTGRHAHRRAVKPCAAEQVGGSARFALYMQVATAGASAVPPSTTTEGWSGFLPKVHKLLETTSQ